MDLDCRGCCLALLIIPVMACVLIFCAVIYVFTSSPEPPVADNFQANQQEANIFTQRTSVSSVSNQGGVVTVDFNERELSSWVALRGEDFFTEQGDSYPFQNVQVGLDNGVMSFYAEYNRYAMDVPLAVKVKPEIDTMGRLSLDISSASVGGISAPQFVLNRATSELEEWLTEPFQELQQRVILYDNTLQIEDGRFYIQGALR